LQNEKVKSAFNKSLKKQSIHSIGKPENTTLIIEGLKHSLTPLKKFVENSRRFSTEKATV